MNASKFLTLGKNDFLKGLVIAFFTALITGIYTALQADVLSFSWEFFKPILISSLLATLAYLLKQLTTNSDGETLTMENPKGL